MSHFRVGTFAIIFDDRGWVLLCLREDPGIWNLPGGWAERGESPWEAVVREVEQETGLEVDVERLAGVYWRPEHVEVLLAFVCRIAGGEFVRTWEAIETGYFALDEIPERTNRRHVARIRDALSCSEETVMETQLGSSWWEPIEGGSAVDA